MADLFSGAIETLSDSLSGLSWRQRVLSHNISNAETPGFKRREVRFEAILQQRAQQAANVAGSDGGENDEAPVTQPFAPEIVTVNAPSRRADGNNVNIEAQMSQLLETELSYGAASQMLSRKLAGLKAIIDGR